MSFFLRASSKNLGGHKPQRENRAAEEGEALQRDGNCEAWVEQFEFLTWLSPE